MKIGILYRVSRKSTLVKQIKKKKNMFLKIIRIKKKVVFQDKAKITEKNKDSYPIIWSIMEG